MAGPEDTQPSTTPDQYPDSLGVSPGAEKEMKSWDEDRLKSFWILNVNSHLAQEKEVKPYKSPSGDSAFAKRVNQIIADHLIAAQENPELLEILPYDINSSSKDTTKPSAIKPDQAADPVNLFNGDFVYSATDLTISGAGIDFVFTRSYSQLLFFRGPIGFNWDHSYNLWLRVENNARTIHRSTGTMGEEAFLKHEDHNYWIPPNGTQGILLENGDSFIFRLPDGSRVIYEPHQTFHPSIHVVARIEDRFGNHLNFLYSDGLLVRVEINHPERIIDFGYDSENRIVSIRDFSGRVWRYDYDDIGNLAAVTTPATEEYKSGLTTRYEYIGALNSDPSLQHSLLAIIDADGCIYLENEIGLEPNLVSYRRVVRQRQGNGDFLFDYADVIEEFDFPYGDHERPAHQTIVTERDGRQVRYLFNRYGNMIFSEEYARIDGLPRLVSSHYRYNRDGNLVGMISPLGVITQALYGRDLYERRFPPDEDYRPETDPNLTQDARLQFDNLLAVIRRGDYHDVNSLNLARGLWADSIFPDVLQTNDRDFIQKLTYETEFTQPLTISDPRFTRSADPAFIEDAEYHRRLTRYTYSPGAGFQHLLLDAIERPRPTLPDGSPAAPVITRFAEFDGNGRIIRTIAPNGLETVYAYSTAAEGTLEGFLKTTTADPGGFDIKQGMERDELGRVVKAFRPPFFDFNDDRFFATWDYNELDQIIRSTSTAPFSISGRHRYNRTGNIRQSEVELKDHTQTIAGSFAVNNRYDEEFNLTSQTIGDGEDETVKQARVIHDRASRPLLYIAASGRKNKVTYNERSLVAKTITDYGGVQATTRHFYDADGRLIRVIDPRGFASRFNYDALGRLVDAQDAKGNRIVRHFDKLGHLLVECLYEKVAEDAFVLLFRREFAYDELGRLIVAGANKFDQTPAIPANQLGSAFIASGPGELLTIQSFYDSVGNLVRQVDQDGRAYESEYDILGRVVRMVDPNGNELRLKYDKEANVTRVDRQEVTRDPITHVITATRHFAETFAYDELNRLMERKTTIGRLRYQYDSRDNPVEIEDPLGNRIENFYDIFSRLIENRQSFHRGEPGETPVPVRTLFTYDPDDQRTTQTDGLGRTTRFHYDSAGRLTGTVLPDGSSDTMRHDRNGNPIEVIDRNGLIRRLEWDELNRNTALQIDVTGLASGVDFAGATAYKAEYDALGRFKAVENEFVINRFTHNSLSHLVQEVTSFTALTGHDPSAQFLTQRKFANSGALMGLIYPSGREIAYTRDILDRLVKVEQVRMGDNYPGDPALPDALTLAAIDYKGLQIGRIARYNGTATEYNYDFGGRTVEIGHSKGPQNVLTLQFLYDALGNMRQKIEVAEDFQSLESFRYDSLSRLFEAQKANTASLLDLSSISPPGSPLPDALPDHQAQIDPLISSPNPQQTTVYNHDLVGNRISKVLGSAKNYQTNDLDQYTQVGSSLLRYDKNGNLIEDDTFRYAYDHRNQLTKITRKANSQEMEIFLDYFGRRCAQEEGARSTLFLYDGHNLIEEYDGGQLARSVISTTRQDDLLVASSGGRDLYLLRDLTGSVRYLFDGAQKRNFYIYDEFGNLSDLLIAADDNPFRFAGKRLLGDTGKYDFIYRTYDPALGKFIQRDPKGYVDGSNLYIYGRNNPLAFQDPYGLESRPEQSISSGLYAGRAASTPVDVNGKPLTSSWKKPAGGNYNLWSGRPGMSGLTGPPGESLAIAEVQAGRGWMMDQTPEHVRAAAAEAKYYANNPGKHMPPDVFDEIWVGASKTVARKAVLSGAPVASWGLDTHPAPRKTVQYQHEIRTVENWGSLSAAGMKFGALLNIYAATQVDNPYIQAIGYAAGATEVFGSTLYFGGALTQETAMMSLGGNLVRFGGGFGLTIVSGYVFIQDVQRGDISAAVGSGANTATGITMLVTSHPVARVATGAFAFGYAGGTWINEKTGWSKSLTERALRNKDIYQDIGLGETSSTILGGAANIPILSEVGEGIGRGAGWLVTSIGNLFD